MKRLNMRQYIETRRDEMDRYFLEHGLSPEKMWKTLKSYDYEDIFFQDSTPDAEREVLGLADDIPAPVILRVTRDGDALQFELSDEINDYYRL